MSSKNKFQLGEEVWYYNPSAYLFKYKSSLSSYRVKRFEEDHFIVDPENVFNSSIEDYSGDEVQNLNLSRVVIRYDIQAYRSNKNPFRSANKVEEHLLFRTREEAIKFHTEALSI